MSEAGGSGGTGLRALFPALTRRSLVRHYFPLSGAACHAALATHILNPDLLPKLLPSHDLAAANLAVINANVGIGLWMYHRAHMRKVSKRTRVMYSVYTASLLNFGSVLLWALTKSILPKSLLVRTLFGALTSLCLLAVGKEYVAYLDFLAADVGDAEPSSSH